MPLVPSGIPFKPQQHPRGPGGKFITSGSGTTLRKSVTKKLGGPNFTRQDIKTYQRKEGLLVDGKIGSQTATSLLGVKVRAPGELGKHLLARLQGQAGGASKGGGKGSGKTTPPPPPVPAPPHKKKPRLREADSPKVPLTDKPGVSNWVEKYGALKPKATNWIRRAAEHLKGGGMSDGHAIAVAKNAAQKLCTTGDLNFPGVQQANLKSKAEACAAIAIWDKAKAQAKAASVSEAELAEAEDVGPAIAWLEERIGAALELLADDGTELPLVEAELTSKSRNALPSSAFVFPKDRRYPIHDLSHARNALARASGKPEQVTVRRAVCGRYKQLCGNVKEAEMIGRIEIMTAERVGLLEMLTEKVIPVSGYTYSRKGKPVHVGRYTQNRDILSLAAGSTFGGTGIPSGPGNTVAGGSYQNMPHGPTLPSEVPAVANNRFAQQRVSPFELHTADGVPMAFPPGTSYDDMKKAAAGMGNGTQLKRKDKRGPYFEIKTLGVVRDGSFNENAGVKERDRHPDQQDLPSGLDQNRYTVATPALGPLPSVPVTVPDKPASDKNRFTQTETRQRSATSAMQAGIRGVKALDKMSGEQLYRELAKAEDAKDTSRVSDIKAALKRLEKRTKGGSFLDRILPRV